MPTPVRADAALEASWLLGYLTPSPRPTIFIDARKLTIPGLGIYPSYAGILDTSVVQPVQLAGQLAMTTLPKWAPLSRWR